MVKLIPGVRGSGKTKLLIEAIRQAQTESKGNVVAGHDVRLINIEDYNIKSCNTMHGFLAGIMASDYDCTHIFVDGILRIVGRNLDEVGDMLDKISNNSNGTAVTLTFSTDETELTDQIKKFL